jgi:hypothetical protein
VLSSSFNLDFNLQVGNNFSPVASQLKHNECVVAFPRKYGQLCV